MQTQITKGLIHVFGHPSAEPELVAQCFGGVFTQEVHSDSDLAIFAINPSAGVDQETISKWAELDEFQIPRLVVVTHLEKLGHEITNHGTDNFDSVDYPDFGHLVAQDVVQGRADFGIVICGSGNGIAMTANKHQDIRAALCWTKEIAFLARTHNDANVLCLPARFISEADAQAIADAFLQTDFEGGRHANRVHKISC